MTEKTNIPQGYKDSPLGIIPMEWEVKRLGDIALRIGDGIHGTPIYTDSSDYYFVNGNNLNNGKIVITESTKCVPYSEYCKYNKNLVKNTILLSINGTIGNIALYDNEKVMLGKSAAYITISNHKYFFFLLQSSRVLSFFEKELTGSTICNLSLDSIRNLKIALPSQNEINVITEIIELWDTAIEKQSELIEKLKLRKRALMQQLLTGKKRLPDFSEEWKEVKLGEIVSFSTQTIETAKIYKERYVGTENMLSDCNGIILYDKDIPYIQVREYKDGDILMSNIRPYLKKIWLSNCDGGCSTDIHVIRNKVNERVNTKFLYYVLMLDTFFEYAMSGAKGSKMPRGDANMLTKYPICYPPITEQLAIINILTDADKEIELAKEKLASLQSQKQGLMQQLLTGKKRIMQL